MTTILETTLPRALDTLLARYGTEACREMRLEAWLYEDVASRRAAEQTLSGYGVLAHLRSAYKPLVHALLEETDLGHVTAITVATPAHEAGSRQRFALEAYPLAGLLPDVPISFIDGAAALDYRVTLDGPKPRVLDVFAPNRLQQDHLGETVLVGCGWLRVWHPGSATPFKDAPLDTEFTGAFDAVMAALAAHPWGDDVPLFPTLAITVETGGMEMELSYQDECVSTREALHEELYFSTLEFFHRRSGHPAGYRGLQPGQIIPDIVPSSGPTRIRVAIEPPQPIAILEDEGEALESCTRPLSPLRIAAELDGLGGARFDVTSVQGRPVLAAHFPGSGAGLLLSAGQHANETSGVVGALRAARLLRDRGVHFALIPQENPDGYALHHRLRAHHPNHMHHAARYSALGDDIGVRAAPPWHEAAARQEAIRRTGAGLHINLHGYPAHEWTRPLTGYVPRGFPLWTIPKGFFLILRHAPGQAERAHRFVAALAAAIAGTPGLRDYNDRHIATYLAHAGELGHPIHHGIPCMVSEAAEPAVPMQLITEYPDETVYDDAFRLAHEVQFATVMAAVELYLTDQV